MRIPLGHDHRRTMAGCRCSSHALHLVVWWCSRRVGVPTTCALTNLRLTKCVRIVAFVTECFSLDLAAVVDTGEDDLAATDALGCVIAQQSVRFQASTRPSTRSDVEMRTSKRPQCDALKGAGHRVGRRPVFVRAVVPSANLPDVAPARNRASAEHCVKVLIAEDDATSRLLLQRAIGQLGHDVFTADDGVLAWGLYSQQDIDVIVSDWLMPGLDGPELCRRVRADRRETYTYFILLTALDDKQHFMQGMQAGADDYLTKPFDRDELRIRLQVASRVTTLHHQLAEKTRELEHANRALAESARHDPLTGLGNRLQLRDDLVRLQQWLDRYGRGFAVGLCDVDRFKLYNDRYGHLAGDDALKAICHEIARTVRAGDMTYRYGGEEMLVIMPEQNAQTSIVGMERVRDAVQRLAIPHARNTPYGVVTISIGLVTIGGGEQLPWEAVLHQADEALYRAKANGRNRVKLGRSSVARPDPRSRPCRRPAACRAAPRAPTSPARFPRRRRHSRAARVRLTLSRSCMLSPWEGLIP